MLVKLARGTARVFSIAALAALLAVTITVGEATAQYSGGIGIVDMERVLNQSKAMLSARSQLDEISSNYQEEISGEEESLRARDAELQQEREILAPDAWNEKAVILQRDIESLDQKILAVRRALDGLFEDSVTRIQELLIEEIGILANERGITLVLPLNSILFATEYFDVTADALARLDTRVPGIELELTEDQLSGTDTP